MSISISTKYAVSAARQVSPIMRQALTRSSPALAHAMTSMALYKDPVPKLYAVSFSTKTVWSPANFHTGANYKPIKEEVIADHSWRQVNRIWSEDEVKEKMASKNMKHVPVTFSDKVAKAVMTVMYHSFNLVTGYQAVDPSPKSIEWRLIILESFAGVPGMLAAGFRHFYSLRTLRRDHGSIFTFLEEAENERMHLLVCLKMFEASSTTKALVIFAQLAMTPALMMTYLVSPPTMHRFVGYLEETAVDTYSNIVHHCETPGTKLHTAWAHLPAPAVGIKYWALAENATWVTCLKHMLADEAHHRDVNHTFATLPQGADNPFITEHMQNFDKAALRRTEYLLKDAIKREGISSNMVDSSKVVS